MFDIGWPELMVVGVLTIIVVGPKELPRVLRTVMGIIRKIRMLAGDFQSSVEDIAREADLEDIKKSLDKPTEDFKLGKIEDLLDPTGEVEESIGEINKDVKKVKSDSVTAANSDG